LSAIRRVSRIGIVWTNGVECAVPRAEAFYCRKLVLGPLASDEE
jgi:hypothetical protein